MESHLRMTRSSFARTLLLILLVAGLGLSVVEAPARAATGVVRFYLFYAADCSRCQAIKDEFLPPLLQKHGSKVEVQSLEISDPAVLQQLIGLESQFGVPADKATVPEVFIGSDALVGEDEIRSRLPGLIDSALAAGGLDLPALPAGQSAATATPPAVVLNEDGQPVARWILFYSESCPHCHEVMENYLPKVYQKYGNQVEHREIEVSQTDNYQTMLGVETMLGVSEDMQGSVPALVIGDKVLIGGLDIPEQLEGLIDQYLAQGGVDYVSLENLPAVVPPTPTPTFQAFLFYHPQDPALADLETFMGGLSTRYGQGFQVIPFDRSDPQYVATLDQLLAEIGGPRPGPTDPVMLVGRQLLVGTAAIREQLPGLVAATLGTDGTALPTVATPEPEPIHIAYFEKAGCQECARTNYDLKLVEKQYPQIVIERFPIESKQAFNKWLAEKYNVPQDKWLSTPMIFVGTDVLIGTEANARNLLAAVGKYAATGAESTWADFDEQDEQQATGDLKDIFLTWGGWKIASAGLIDGLNPCAFATLIFFISYMAFTGRRGRDILLIGAAFTLGIFVTYLLIGFGLSKVIQSIPGFSTWGRWVYILTGVLCVVLAVLTIRDFVRARRGQASDMTLKLPASLRKRINRVIREGAQMRAFVPIAFFTGLIVSLIELACTGQIYGPTIIMMLSVPEMASRAFIFLLIYCIAFIIPLVLVFVLSYFGTTSEQLGQFLGKHTATIKALTAALFVGLALWMAWAVAPLFGLNAPWNLVLLLVVLAAIALGVVATRPWVKPAPKTRRRPVSQKRKSRA